MGLYTREQKTRLESKNAIHALQVSQQLCTFALNLQKPSYKWRRFSNHTPI